MWKYCLYFCIFILICFLMPSFFIRQDVGMLEDIKSEEENIYESSNYNKIRLLLKEQNEVIELSMDDYIKGVLLRRNANRF